MTLDQARRTRPGAPVVFWHSQAFPSGKRADFVCATGYLDSVVVLVGPERWTVRACEIEHEAIYLKHKADERKLVLELKAKNERVKWWKARQRVIRHYLSGGKWSTFPEGIPAPAFINVIAAAKKRRVLVDSEDKIV